MAHYHHPLYDQFLREIEDVDRLFSGGWKVPRGRGGFLIEHRVKAEQQKTSSRTGSSSRRGPSTIAAPMMRTFRPTAPIAPPVPGDGLKHFGLIHSTIYKQNGQRRGPERAVYIEAGGILDGVISAEARATDAALYAEGHASDHPERVVWIESNIAEDFAGRVDFWRKVNENTRPAIDATVTLDIRGREREWEAIGVDRMQHDVRRAYGMALEQGGRASVVVNSADAAWRYANAKEHRELFETTLQVARQANDIVMCSAIAPLPHTLSPEGKLAVAKKYTEFFRSRGLPF